MRIDQEFTARHGLLVLSHEHAARFVPGDGEPLVMIRMTHHKNRFLPLRAPRAYRDILLLQFDDVIEDSHEYQGMTDEDAERVAAFLLKHRGVNLVVHCDAGISRSSAVGFCWAELNDKPQVARILVDSGGFYKPNRRVIYQVRKALAHASAAGDGTA